MFRVNSKDKIKFPIIDINNRLEYNIVCTEKFLIKIMSIQIGQVK